jgi:hypothetical protein
MLAAGGMGVTFEAKWKEKPSAPSAILEVGILAKGARSPSRPSSWNYELFRTAWSESLTRDLDGLRMKVVYGFMLLRADSRGRSDRDVQSDGTSWRPSWAITSSSTRPIRNCAHAAKTIERGRPRPGASPT